MSSELPIFKRRLKIDLPSRQSAFLWGARKTGKTTFLAENFPNSLKYDLLKSDLYLDFLKEPHRFREDVLFQNPSPKQQPIIIDEVQKVPALLDEVHWLIENKNYQFILCGSSARKLKKQHANMLGGRAWRYEMLPLATCEVPHFDLLRAFNHGLLPQHYTGTQHYKSLKSYVLDYLTEEIRAEGLARNLPAFARFLDAASYSNGQLVNYVNIASDCGVDSKTVKEYFQILVDTHLGYFVNPLTKKKGRKSISSVPKFYFFDVGLANFLSKSKIETLKGSLAGISFEQFILMEVLAHKTYGDFDFDIRYWRTHTDLEVDFILGTDVYVEVKISDNIKKSDITGMLALLEEAPTQKAFVVCQEKRPRLMTIDKQRSITVLPWPLFLQKLWVGEVVV